MSVTSRYVNRLNEPTILVQPGVADPLTARLAEHVGFEAVDLSGWAMGSRLGVPEPFLSLDKVCSCVRDIAVACSLPVMADVGAGWGGPVHVIHTVQRLERAGAASIHIEDQVFPKEVSYHKGVVNVIPVDDMVSKVRAAVSARRSSDFLICARTDAGKTDGNYDDAIKRARAYVEAGADMMMMFPTDEATARSIPRDVPNIPLVCNNAEGNHVGREIFQIGDLQDWGWKVVNFSATATLAATQAIVEVFDSVRRLGRSGVANESLVSARSLVESLLHLSDYYEVESEAHKEGSA